MFGFLVLLGLVRLLSSGDGTILSLAKYCANLETLLISGCWLVSDDAVKSLATACGSSLKVLGLDSYGNISDSTVSCILRQCRNLEALNIAGCTKLIDAGCSSSYKQ